MVRRDVGIDRAYLTVVSVSLCIDVGKRVLGGSVAEVTGWRDGEETPCSSLRWKCVRDFMIYEAHVERENMYLRFGAR